LTAADAYVKAKLFFSATTPFTVVPKTEEIMSNQLKNDSRGAGFLVDDNKPGDVFSPEDFTEDQVAISEAVTDFMKQEVSPKAVALEEHDYELLKGLIRQVGELGFLGVDLPEAFGGSGLDMTSSALVFEGVGGCGSGSFAAAVGAHSGIGTWPILYFGSDEQRQRWLPGILTGEKIAAYALTESGSGSDALAAKCKAELTEDGRHYKVNGEKVFITNAAIADIFTIFVKIDGDDDKKACLVVERGSPGFSIDKEEHKMGIRGSSTCRLVFDDCLVPAENLLGAVGKGHKVVLNTLNLGRFKLGAAAAGAIKALVATSVQYAAERKQFGQPLLAFDAIRAKIAEMVIAGWVGESMVYRTAGLLAGRLHGAGSPEAATKAIEEYTVECSLVKVALSEMLNAAADEAVQIFGGYGYSEEYPVARCYRDARINRIFEGTNEINRMLAVAEVMKRALQGRVDIFAAAKGRTSAPPPKARRRGRLGKLLGSAKQLQAFAGHKLRQTADRLPVRLVRNGKGPATGSVSLRETYSAARSAALYALTEAAMCLQAKLKDEQQILFALADLLLALYGMESSLLRLEKIQAAGGDAELAEAVVRAWFSRALGEIETKSTVVMAALYGGSERLVKTARIREMLASVPLDDIVGLKRRIGAAAAEKNGYPF